MYLEISRLHIDLHREGRFEKKVEKLAIASKFVFAMSENRKACMYVF